MEATTYDVLTVTPRGGKNFDAWFDAKTHLLSRVVEQQGPQTSTTTLSDYQAVSGVELPYKSLISTGIAKYDQALAIKSAAFIAMPSDATFVMPESKVADFTIAGGAPETTVAFELINNHIYAPASVNGKQFTFIFDTGGVNLVTPPTAQALGLKSQGAMQGNGAGEGHMDIALTKVEFAQGGQRFDQGPGVPGCAAKSNVKRRRCRAAGHGRFRDLPPLRDAASIMARRRSPSSIPSISIRKMQARRSRSPSMAMA